MLFRNTLPAIIVLVWIGFISQSSIANAKEPSSEVFRHFAVLLTGEPKNRQQSINHLRKTWHPGYVPMILETLRLFNDDATAKSMLGLLREKTGQNYGQNLDKWFRWLWKQPEHKHPEYAEFKAELYRLLDPKFAKYFSPQHKTKIRLDEVRWGGVHQDGIPPLRQPKMIKAKNAHYLKDNHIVFGVAHNGDIRAYPKRILAWHEMFVDTIGGTEFAGVYCTLCGTVIMYKTQFKGVKHQLGTSGFLYRSNKLMYDKATQSLWNTTWGRPVIGSLVDKGIELERSYVVTTTWGEWRRRHPSTKVLSINTGFKRDYREGAAYADYFATDRLMFAVPKIDKRLRNKDEVLTLRFSDTSATLAIYEGYLRKHPVHHDRVGKHSFVVLTDRTGANRVYNAAPVQFVHYDGDRSVTDKQGAAWQLTEDALIAKDGRRLKRLPANRAFWFGWYAAYNDTRLVK